MNETTKRFFLKLNLDLNLDGSEYLDWAFTCLEEGFDSKSLRLLAGFNRNHPYKSDLEQLFRQSLNELGWKYLSDKEVLFDYAKSLAKQIVSSELDSVKGVEKISSLYIQLGFPNELQMWNLLYDGHSSEWFDKSRWLPFIQKYNQEKWLEAVKSEAVNLANMKFSEIKR